MRIKKGDTVIVIAGKDKGKKGEVIKAMPKEQSDCGRYQHSDKASETDQNCCF